MIDAPAPSSSSGVTPLTAPSVPTGMNAGVSTTPCAVVRRPRRAAPSVARTSNRRSMGRPSGLALRAPLPAEVDRAGRHPRRQLQHEAVLGDRGVALEIAELVLDAVAVRL